MNSIPESTKAWARKHIGCGGEGVSLPEGYPYKSGERTLLYTGDVPFVYHGNILCSSAEVSCDTTKIVAGKTYKVTFNGAEYQCKSELGSFDRPYLGAYNTGEMDEDLPFNIDVMSDTLLNVFTSLEEGTYTLTIELDEQTIVTMAEEYIPASYINELIDKRLNELGVTTQS